MKKLKHQHFQMREDFFVYAQAWNQLIIKNFNVREKRFSYPINLQEMRSLEQPKKTRREDNILYFTYLNSSWFDEAAAGAAALDFFLS